MIVNIRGVQGWTVGLSQSDGEVRMRGMEVRSVSRLECTALAGARIEALLAGPLLVLLLAGALLLRKKYRSYRQAPQSDPPAGPAAQT